MLLVFISLNIILTEVYFKINYFTAHTMQLLCRHRVKFFMVYKLTRMNTTISIVLVYLIINPSNKHRNPCIDAVCAHSSAASSPRNDACEHPSFVSYIQ